MQIGRAIALIHREPERPWTVAMLARELAMSRSAFAARFTEVVGEPVMQYVACWRMQVAAGSLRDEGATVGELAARLGYRSEAAFARAFKRIKEELPGAVRRRGASDEISFAEKTAERADSSGAGDLPVTGGRPNARTVATLSWSTRSSPTASSTSGDLRVERL